MTLYRIEVTLAATAYVQAESEEDAIAKTKRMAQGSPDIEAAAEFDFCDLQFDDPDLPEWSLSPAMTLLESDNLEAEEADG